MSTTTTNRTPVLVSNPYAASRSSMACSRPRSPESPVPADACARARVSNTSIVDERMSENCSAVQIDDGAVAWGE